jgi:PAS domain S-box-containing protein
MSTLDRLTALSLRRWTSIIAIIVLLAGLGVYLLFEHLRGQARAAATETLRSVAMLKSAEIERWLTDRLIFLAQLPGGIDVSHFASLLLGNGAAATLLESRLQLLHATMPEVKAIWLYDRDGRARLGSRGTRPHRAPGHAAAALKVMTTRQAGFVDLYRVDTVTDEVVMEIMVPLMGSDTAAAPVGYAVFQIDPALHLFSLVREWPISSATAETLLVRREGDELVNLSTLRHRAIPPLALRLPLASPGLIAARGLLTGEEPIAGVDYRGISALGVVLKVSGTDWFLVAKMDDSEIYAAAYHTLYWVGAGIALLLAMMLALGRALFSRQQAEAQAALLAQDKARLETLAAHHRVEASLAENESRLRSLGNNLPDSYVYQVTQTAEGKRQFLYLSSGIERIHGLVAAKVVQDPGLLYEQIETEDLQGILAAEQVSLDRMADFGYEFRIRNADGQVRWLYVRSHPSRRADGQVVWDGLASDITGRKQTESRLQEALMAAERFRLALDHVAAHVFIKDHESRYVYANRALLDMFGCTVEELIGAPDDRFFPAETAKRLREIDLRVLAGENTAEEVDISHLGGERHVYWEVKAPIYLGGDSDTVWGLCGIATDVTEKKIDEEMLALQSRRAEALLKLPSLADVTSESAFMQLGQQFAEDLTGSVISFIHFVNEDEETIELVAWSQRTLEDYCEAAYEQHYPVSQAGIWADALRMRQPVIVNDYAAAPGKHGLPEGHAALLRIVSVPVLEQGKVVMLTGVGNKATPYTVYDVETVQLIASAIWRIVQRRRAEQATRDALAAQRALIQKLEEAQNQLLQSEKMASIGQLAAGVAHELNNPIGFVNSNLGTLDGYLRDLFAIADAYADAAASALPECPQLDRAHALKQEKDYDFLRADTFQLLAESKEGLSRVAKIVKDLKDFSRAGEATYQWADLHQGLDSTLNIVWNELKYKCTVTKDYGDLPRIWCVPSQLNQVFMNLLVNAAHAIPEKGEIAIRTGSQGDEIFVAIADTGTGIAPEHLNRIFEPFFTTKPVGKGTGLGLSLAYSIVQKHQGRFEVHSELGKGSVFTVWLPTEARSA